MSDASLAVAVFGAIVATSVVLVAVIYPFWHDIFRCIGRDAKGAKSYELNEF